MTVDTKRLRRLAEDVLNSKPDFCGGNWRTHYDYEKPANPQAIIALIDELEKTKAQLAEANAVDAWYGDEKNWDDEGICGTWRGSTYSLYGPCEPEWDFDTGERARRYLEKWKVGK